MKKVFLLLLTFAGLTSFSQSNTSTEKMKASTSINDMMSKNSLLSFKVLSYNVFYQPKGGDAETFKNNGPYFSPEVKKAIQKAKAGEVYYIEEIKVMGPDNITRKIPGITFKID
jgi:hypothetical protein